MKVAYHPDIMPLTSLSTKPLEIEMLWRYSTRLFLTIPYKYIFAAETAITIAIVKYRYYPKSHYPSQFCAWTIYNACVCEAGLDNTDVQTNIILQREIHGHHGTQNTEYQVGPEHVNAASDQTQFDHPLNT